MGGDNARHKADMLLANFVTKIFHNNADPETNRWASDTIGRALQRRGNYNEGQSFGQSAGMNEGGNRSWGSNSGWGSSVDARGNTSSSSNFGTNRGGGESFGRNIGRNSGGSESQGYSETMDYIIEPGAFGNMLRTGGPQNGGMVSAVWFQAGKTFRHSNGNATYAVFRQ